MFTLKWSNDPVFYVYDTELQQSGIGVSVDWSLTYDGGTLDITSWELEFVIRPFAGSDVAATLPNADITKDASGNISFTTNAAFTTGLDPRTYIFELRRTDGGHEKIIRFGNWALYATPLVAPVATTGGIVPIDLGGTGEDLSLEGPSVIVQLTTGANLTALPADLSSTTLFLRKDLTWQVPSGVGTGTVTDFIFTNANGVSGVVTTSTSTPTLTLTLGAITPTSVNSVVISGSSTPTLAVTGTTTVSGANTGDQNLFSAIAVSGQTTITANSATTTLTVVGSTNITVTTDNTTKTLTIAATGVGTGTVTSVSVVTANGVSGSVANPTTTPAITLTLGAITPTSVNGNTITTGTGTLTLSTFTVTAAANATISGTNTGDQTITLTSDVTGSGTGSFATTISANAVTNTKLADMATQTFKGRTTAGTGDPEDLTATQATAILNVFVGDSGSGGPKGLVPATIAGDSARYLKGSGGWTSILFTVGRNIYGNFFDGSADLTQVIASTYGGTGNGFTKISGPTTSEKTFTLPNASAKILTDNAAVLVAEGGTGRQTGTTAYALVATGTTPTGTQQTLANGATTEILVGGGSTALPVWTTAQGSGAPVRATGPTLTGAVVNGVTLSGSSSTLTVTGSASISNANTGDQVITLTGHVTGGPTASSMVTTIQPNVVTEAMQNLSDVTTNNVSTSKHGYAPKAPNNANVFLDGTGNYSTPSGTGIGTVTSVSVVTANGVSGSVANPTSTPAITLTLGNITPTTVNGLTITTTTGTLSILSGKIATINNSLTFNGTDGSAVQFLQGGTVAYRADNLSVFASTTSSDLRGVISDEVGSGLLVFNDTPLILTPAITAPVITGGSVTRVIDFGIRAETGTSAFDLKINSTEVLSASRTLTITTGDANRVLTFTGDASIRGTNTGDQLYTASGDATAPSSASNLALTLATVATAGTAGSSTAIPSVTIDIKGRVLTLGTNAIFAPAGNLTGTSLATNVVTSSITTFVDPIANATWNATNISLGKGGTGASLSAPAGDRIFFFDQSAGSSAFLDVGAGLAISGTTLNVTAGGGDFFGPSGATQNALVVFANTTGKLGKNSTVTISDNGSLVVGGSSAAITIGDSTAGILNFRDAVGSNVAITAGTNALTIGGSATLSATTFIGALVGNASTATTLQTSRNIYGNPFNGSANVTGTIDLTYGGLGYSLSAPASDKIYFYDQSAGHSDFLTVGAGLTITGTTINATSGGGDFFGPSGATDSAIVLFDTTTGKLGKNSPVTVSSTGNINIVSGSDIPTISFANFASATTGARFRAPPGEADTLNFQAWNGTSWSTLFFIQSQPNESTVYADLDGSHVTIGGNYIYRQFGTDVSVQDGGTGRSLATAYAPVCGGTTTTAALQSVSASGAAAGMVLTFVSTSNLPTWQTPATSGTVTSVSVVTANGVSGSVSNPTTMPAITLTLGAITPTTVNGNTFTTGSGTLTITGTASISGTNTGDQTFVTGNAGTVTFVDAGGDTTTWLALGRNQTGDQSPATDSGLTYNATTDQLTIGESGTFGKLGLVDSSGSTLTFQASSTNNIAVGGSTTLSCSGGFLGNATTAATLQTTRSIFGANFNGGSDISSPVSVPFGGSSRTSATAYMPICGGTTSVSAHQSVSSSATVGQFLTFQGASLPTWTTGGDFVGPASATDNAIVLFNGTTGKLGKNSSVTISGGTILVSGSSSQSLAFSGATVSGVTFSGSASLIQMAGEGTVAAGTNNNEILQLMAYDGIAGIQLAMFRIISKTGANHAVANLSTLVTIGSDAIYHGGTAYAPVCGGTTAVGANQSATTGMSTTGYIFTTNGTSALPSFQSLKTLLETVLNALPSRVAGTKQVPYLDTDNTIKLGDTENC